MKALKRKEKAKSNNFFISMVRWKFWKKRTETEIKKARLLELANHSLQSAIDFSES